MKQKIKENLLGIIIVVAGLILGFNVAQAAEITSISPDLIDPGVTEVIINGSGFGNPDGHNKIEFGDGIWREGMVLSWSDTEILAKSSMFLNGEGKIRVKICRDAWDFNCTEIIGPNYYLKPDFFAPDPGKVGDEITINCYHCGDSPGNLTLNGINIATTYWVNYKIKFIVPNGASSGDIIITNSGGYSSKGKYFEILQPCTSDTWSCGDWNACSIYGSQTRTCSKTFDCSTANTPSPLTSQSCTPPRPFCTSDIWNCSEWSSCSPSGVQSRSCTKTFDCSDVQTAPPTTDQYCEPINRPTSQTPPSSTDEIPNQDSIIKSTVKLLCPVDIQRASQGSGTIIDPSGTILTNKHVIAGTLGCLVGFVNDFNDEPYFGERQIADVLKVSSNDDVAILKIRNPQNKILTSIDITKGNSNFRLGARVIIYGYPAKFGTKITYTSGDFSGIDGSYLKTTAILEYGNSGGGAFLKDGTFIGIPSAVVKGELNALGYILSINTIKAWLGNASIISDGTNNNYSRVSVLEDIDLKKLDSLQLFIPNTDSRGNLSAPAIAQNQKNVTGQTQQPNQTQEKSTIIESIKPNQKINLQQSSVMPEKEGEKQKVSWIKRFFSWITKLFK